MSELLPNEQALPSEVSPETAAEHAAQTPAPVAEVTTPEAPVAEASPVPTEVSTDTAPTPVENTTTTAETVAVPVKTEAEIAEEARLKEEERARKEEDRKRKDEAYAELETLKAQDAAFDVTIIERVKGGLRGEFKSLRVFLPASHFGLRKNVSEEDMNQLVGQTISVKVHELQNDDTGYKSAVVTRKDILTQELWNGLQVGAVHEGVVSSVTSFGAFVNIDGAEGLVHVSQLSNTRVDNAASVVKKGDKLKVTITEIDIAKKKLSLSHKPHEASPWAGISAAFPIGKVVAGTVKRITDFGAYVQVAPKIDGLLRISELSWTQRVKHPSDIVSVGQQINVAVLEVNEAKHQMALGYKQTLENPWNTLAEKLPIGTETQGVIQSVSPQGSVVRLAETFDGFMPRSRTLNAGKGQKVALAPGDTITVVVVDSNPEKSSLIVAMKAEDGTIAGQNEGPREGGREGGRNERNNSREDFRPAARQPQPDSPGMTLGDLLKDADKSNLLK